MLQVKPHPLSAVNGNMGKDVVGVAKNGEKGHVLEVAGKGASCFGMGPNGRGGVGATSE